jgi:hypothetical protein
MFWKLILKFNVRLFAKEISKFASHYTTQIGSISRPVSQIIANSYSTSIRINCKFFSHHQFKLTPLSPQASHFNKFISVLIGKKSSLSLSFGRLTVGARQNCATRNNLELQISTVTN